MFVNEDFATGYVTNIQKINMEYNNVMVGQYPTKVHARGVSTMDRLTSLP